MILDIFPDQYVQMTAALTNVVIAACLPIINDVGQKLDLDLPRPVVPEAIQVCQPSAETRPVFAGAGFTLTNGFYIEVLNGMVNRFGGPLSPWKNDKVYFAKGPTNAPFISEQQAIVLARSALTNMGYSLEDSFALYEGFIRERVPADTNLPARFYRVEWGHIVAESMAVVICDVDAQRQKLVGFGFRNWYQIPPNTNWLTLPPGRTNWNGALLFRSSDFGGNPAYAEALVPIVFSAIDEYAKKLDLPVPRPLTTNQVARFQYSDNGGWPDVHVYLTNGGQFIYRNTMVNGYYGPDCIWEDDSKYWPVKKLFGQWRMTEAEAVVMARQAVLRAGYPAHTLFLDEKPEVQKPHTPGGPDIPRYYIEWKHRPDPEKEFTAWTRVEINADKKTVESVYHDAKVFWGKKPPIDLPMFLPEKRRIEPMRIPGQ